MSAQVVYIPWTQRQDTLPAHCMLGYAHTHTPYAHCTLGYISPVNRMTDRCKNITLSQVPFCKHTDEYKSLIASCEFVNLGVSGLFTIVK